MAINKAKIKCNKPRLTPDGPKKFVVKACQDGTVSLKAYKDMKAGWPKKKKTLWHTEGKAGALVSGNCANEKHKDSLPRTLMSYKL